MAERLETLIDAERIEERVRELALEISRDYRGKDLIVAGVLKGCFVFLADLVRKLELPVTIDFFRVASYGTATASSGVVEIRKDLEVSVTGRDVLIVEDIVDTGLTLDYLRRHLAAAHPRSVRICALLEKEGARLVDTEVEYLGFRIGNQFVVGYGLDWADKYRQLDTVCVLHRDEEPEGDRGND